MSAQQQNPLVLLRLPDESELIQQRKYALTSRYGPYHHVLYIFVLFYLKEVSQ